MVRSLAEISPRPIDRLLGGYLLLTAAAFFFPHRPAEWPLFAAAHLAIAALLLTGAPARVRARVDRKIVRALVDWYPLLLMPLLYWELPQLIGSVWGDRFFDPVVLGWEEGLFGHQPSTTMARRWDSLALSEVLHLAYISYYPVIYVFPAVLYLRGRRAAFRDSLFALMMGFTISYVLFTIFPVQGPRYLFPAPGGEPARGLLYRLTHAILESGSSQGAAFPSSHAGVAAIQTVNALRHWPAAVPVLALATLGICVSAVYGGFHYAVDMVAGVALGLVVALLAPAARRALR